MPAATRREAWEEPDTLLTDGNEEVSATPATPARLGVLPSPGIDVFTINGSPEKVRRAEHDGVDPGVETVIEAKQTDDRSLTRKSDVASVAPATSAEIAPALSNISAIVDQPLKLETREVPTYTQKEPPLSSSAPEPNTRELGMSPQHDPLLIPGPPMLPAVPVITPLVAPELPQTPKARPYGPLVSTSPLSFFPSTTAPTQTPTRPQTPLPRLSEEAQHADSPNSTVFATPLSTPARPRQERKFSARDFLPSQQRNRASSASGTPVGTPRRQSLVDAGEDLYGSTHVATRAPWQTDGNDAFIAGGSQRLAHALASQNSGASTQARNDEASVGLEGGKSAAPTAIVAPSAVPAETWDKQSVVSAQEDVVADVKPGEVDDAGSRRSSVSSLGDPDMLVAPPMVFKRQSFIATPDKRLSMADPPTLASKEVVPAVPSSAANVGMLQKPESSITPGMDPGQTVPESDLPAEQRLSQEQRFTERLYRQDTTSQRPMSYMPLLRKSSGVPAQENQDIGPSESPSAPVDLTALAGPPPGTQPFQQHPAHRNSVSRPPSEYDMLRMSITTPSEPKIPLSAGPPDRRSKRFSFFRADEQVSVEPAIGVLPPPNRINDQYGIEDTQVTQLTQDMERVDRADTQTKRRSSIWGTLRRSTSTSLNNFTRPGSSHSMLSNAKATPTPVPNTLRKPQRTVSAAVEPAEPKKKRFSKLGSIFGRSNTQGRGTEKPNRLTKAQPPQQEGVQRYNPPSASVVGGSANGYDAYEDMRSRQNRAPRQQRVLSQPQIQAYAEPVVSSACQPSRSRTSSLVQPQNAYDPQSQEVYGSQAERYGYYQPSSQPAPGQASHPGVRRLHSANYQPQPQMPNVPEAFRPVEASYGHPVAPISPPMEQQNAQMYAQGAAPSHSRQSSMNSVVQSPAAAQIPPHYAPQRPVMYGNDNFPQAPGRQDYQTQYWHPQQQQTHRTVPSPGAVRTDMGAPYYDESIASGGGDQQMARSPAREYPEQQTPWSIDMPPSGNGVSGSRASSWAMDLNRSPEPYQYSGPPRAARGAVSSPPPHSLYSQVPWEDHPRQGQRHPSQPRYHRVHSGGPVRQFSPQQEAPPLTYQRTPSGYTGRRDDAAVSESDLLQMRGASYPGQEWRPDR
jgi:hypothetical protein